ncbi:MULTISPECIES: MarR family winged helix-turn-helix transcriptional regulator [unclassified Janthinobacterium]|uniref:MarR family winged helix-turn-helix transcriptional regulator n=1 Tax=unclassified Janthinobacterium TaxID=2610881 RepID=UPI00161C2914|nr:MULTISPECIES: MarR family winged helix-turn-helix transcriptional regulator [unclassified Janthinobacterium]MBB5371754.1 DNA-binding MarR family transcriptional regulator [Janthinobacterium sp. K2C7]MBB5384559.1 DNA-binding MarR family transcriptional regulator [Janthinobacterium sp. K2Li3]MBB5389835.1 DNA-binding MarR family transcriptional regulator [Janthinobacterium sp. K2E3]
MATNHKETAAIRQDARDTLVCNGAALRKASRRVTQLYDGLLAPCGLTISQRSVLVHVQRASSPTMSELAHAMVLDRSALARNLKPLEREGYLVQTHDEHDGRSRRVSLTPSGRAKLKQANLLWRKAQTRFEKTYGPERSAALRLALADIFSDQFAEAFLQA